MFFFINSLNSDFPLFRLGSFNSPSYYFLRKTRKKLAHKVQNTLPINQGDRSLTSHPQRHKSLAKLQNLNRIASICKNYFMKMEQSL